MTPDERAILKAAKSGDLEGLKKLAKKEKRLLSVRDAKDGSSLLHCAAWKGHKEVVEFLLEAGLPVDDQNQNGHWGTTPLQAAAHGNNREVAEILLAHGAEVNFRSPLNKLTALGHAQVHNASSVAKLLANHGARL
jgi:26S proteasome non-ATPase regulatory subunit 10